MHKKILFLLTGAIALSISAVPVLASDPPTDDGQYIWQDENGDYWYRKKYDLLSTISQYSKDASDEWKEMYDTYLDVINGIRIMDGCSLTEGSHA